MLLYFLLWHNTGDEENAVGNVQICFMKTALHDNSEDNESQFTRVCPETAVEALTCNFYDSWTFPNARHSLWEMIRNKKVFGLDG